MTDHLINLDATELINYLKNGKTTSEKIVQTYINHIKEVNPSINAMIETRFQEAIIEAKNADQEENQPFEKYPLFGIPISVKESFHIKNMKTTGGLIHRQDIISSTDATAVKKLKDAGAIILGKTNTPTLCFCQETDNKLYGRTNNAWDQTLTAGGSSGGEGALLAVGGAPLGIGSDIGGSIRFPAHFNGTIGFKPGRDQVDAEGHFPNSHPLQKRMLGIGPMGKSVRDMKLMYDIISTNKPKTKQLNEFDITVFYSDQLPLSDKTKEILQSIESFLKSGFSLDRSTPPLFYQTSKIWQELMSVNGAEEIKKLGLNRDRPGVLSTYMKEKLTRGSDIHPHLSWALIGAQLFSPLLTRIKYIIKALQKGDQTLASFLDKRLLIFPVYHSTAPKHGQVYSEIFSIRKTYTKYMPYIAYANVWGLPSLTIPVTEDENNLPISIQIMGLNGYEDAIFQLGEIIEKEYRGYIRSTIYD